MFRTTDIVLIAVMVSAAAFTYKTKHDAEAQYGEIRRLEQAIRFEEDTLTVLKADWSLLTQPSRLQKLTEIYESELTLKPVEAHQIVGIDELPVRPVDIDDFSSRRLGGMAEIDGAAITGGVTQ